MGRWLTRGDERLSANPHAIHPVPVLLDLGVTQDAHKLVAVRIKVKRVSVRKFFHYRFVRVVHCVAPLAIVTSLAPGDRPNHHLSYWSDLSPSATIDRWIDPSPGPWAFHTHVYGLPNVLLDRDGRVLTTNVRRGDGAVMAVAPAMVNLLADLIAGTDPAELRDHAKKIVREIARRRPRQPGDDDE